jgi:hypothetical protein
LQETTTSNENAFTVSLAVADFFVGMSAVPSLFFCEMEGGCDSQGLVSDGIGFIRCLFWYEFVQFSTRSIHCRRETFKILDFYEAPPCNSNDFHILDNPYCV